MALKSPKDFLLVAFVGFLEMATSSYEIHSGRFEFWGKIS